MLFSFKHNLSHSGSLNLEKSFSWGERETWKSCTKTQRACLQCPCLGSREQACRKKTLAPNLCALSGFPPGFSSQCTVKSHESFQITWRLYLGPKWLKMLVCLCMCKVCTFVWICPVRICSNFFHYSEKKKMRGWILASESSAFACKSLWWHDFLMCEEGHLILLWSCIFFCVWSPRSSSSESASWGNSMRGNRGGATRKWSSSAERRRGGTQRENRFIHLVEHHIKTLLLYPDRQYGATEICQNLPLNSFLFLFLLTCSPVSLNHSDFTCPR